MMEPNKDTSLKLGERLIKVVDSEECLHIEHYLLVNPVLVEEKQLYGVEVRNVVDQTCFRCEDLHTDRELVVALLELMLQGEVTPICAQDVVYDWLVCQMTLQW